MPVPRPTVRSAGWPGQRGGERGRRRGVADADLAEHEAVDAAVGELAGEARAGRERERDLLGA